MAATHYPAVAAAIVRIIAESVTAFGTTQGRRPTMSNNLKSDSAVTMSNDLKAFLLSLGGLLAVAGSGLMVLWAVLH
jgi:hypothetical protein